MSRAAELGHPFAQGWIARRSLVGQDGWRGFLWTVSWFASVPWLPVKLISNEETDPNLLDP